MYIENICSLNMYVFFVKLNALRERKKEKQHKKIACQHFNSTLN